MMADIEKVIKGLQAHADGCGYRSHHCDAMGCPYRYGDESCDIEGMCRDALELLTVKQCIRLFNEREYIARYTGDALQLMPDVMQELVRCKDCKDACICSEDWVICTHIDSNGNDKHSADWFCADGERKSDEKGI